ncbi:MAG: hypothetical protein CVU98_04260 [Firmicutes bacterium HGW-Firmicutes-3]|jgi:hypothetical protein|nr:MAG: hypothetical protein CVU98_04260 [Firmicutes bacterium HGW-Firmicutes-3]
MKLSSREKIYVTLLLVASLSFLAYVYVIEPQAIEILGLYETKNEVVATLALLEDAEAHDAALDAAITKEYEAITELAKANYSTTPQEAFILLLTDIFTAPELKVYGMDFPTPEVVELGGLTALNTDIMISFNSDYTVLRNILETVWQFPRKLRVNSLSLFANEEEETIEGTVTIGLSNILLDPSMVDSLYAWYVDELFNKDNPFVPYSNTNATMRYIYVGEGSNLFNLGRFDAFTDILGHWLEKEINAFLKNGYVYMNPYKTFTPEQPIKRGDFVVLLDNVYKWVSTGETVDVTAFTDYENLGNLESSYAKAIQKGFLSGFVEGYDDNTLRPSDPITYEEVELIMQRIKGDNAFSWSTVSSDITEKMGVTSPTWTDPKATMTKAEAVYLLYYFK